MRCVVLLAVVVCGCGEPRAETPTVAPRVETTAEAPIVAAPAPAVAPVAATPPPVPRPAPDDFTMSVESGPVAGWMRAGDLGRTARLEPRPGATAEFDIVESRVEYDGQGAPGAPVDMRRLAVPADRVAALHEILERRRTELEAPCVDPGIVDGAVTRIEIHVAGRDHSFVCTNATTPAFTELAEAFRALREETLRDP